MKIWLLRVWCNKKDTLLIPASCLSSAWKKSLKAYLLARTNDYPRAHKLVDLLDRCAALEPGFTQFYDDCARVDQYYIPTRYPDGIPGSTPDGMPSTAQATQAVASAAQVLDFVAQRLSQP